MCLVGEGGVVEGVQVLVDLFKRGFFGDIHCLIIKYYVLGECFSLEGVSELRSQA